MLDTLSAQIKALAAQITEQLGLHADAHVFTSLPAPGSVRTAYDPALHKALQRLLKEDKPMALDTALLMRPAGKPDQLAQPAG